jgi:hypothetical protein
MKCNTNFTFTVENISTHEKQVVLGTRLKFFREGELGLTEELQYQAEFTEGELCTVEKFDGIRERNGELELKAIWLGLEVTEATWESAKNMDEDIHGMVQEYRKILLASGTRKQIQLARKL